MQPSEALSASAQVAVTLAGFAGVVVAFRNRSVHEWSNIDKFRLQILLTNSGTPFVLSIFAMVLLSTSLGAPTIWRLCSLFTFIMLVAAGSSYGTVLRRFSPKEFKASGVRRAILFSGSVFASAVTLLQLYNVIRLQTSGRFFAAIATLLVLAMLQFILLVAIHDDAKS